MTEALRATLERELKLTAESSFELPSFDGEPLATRTFTSMYHDTSDGRLIEAGITMRRRVENRRSAWQLKLPSSEGRIELETPGAKPGEKLLSLLAGVMRGRALEEVGRLRTARSGWRCHVDGSTADVTLDRVAVLEGGRTAHRFAEVEIELVAGSADVLETLGAQLRAMGARKHDGRPKIAHALRAEPPIPVPADAPPTAHVQAMLTAQYRAMVAHDPGVRLGADPEDLHQLRVATRRLRAILRAARGVVEPEWANDLRRQVAWLGALLGPVRDADVLHQGLAARRELLDESERRGLDVLLQILDKEAIAARAELTDAMGSDRYFALLDTIEHAAAAPRFTDSAVSLATIARREFIRLRKAVRALSAESTDDELHAIRIRGKRARYAAELAEASVGKPAARFVRRAKELQDVIGEHQDAVVAEAALRRAAGQTRSTAAAMAAGRLIEQERKRKRRKRRAFARAWACLDAAGRRALP